MSRSKIKSVLSEKKLKAGDEGILYVTSCSDINPWMQYNRGFTEFRVRVVIPSMDKDGDTRYLISCAEDLRDEPIFGGLYSYEALVSSHSPFLMTKEEYHDFMNDTKLLDKLLSEYEHILRGHPVQSRLKNWQKEVRKVNSRLCMGVDKVISDIREDFLPETRKELVCFWIASTTLSLFINAS